MQELKRPKEIGWCIKLVEMVRKNDTVIMISVMLEDKILNIISSNAPKVGCEESLKE